MNWLDLLAYFFGGAFLANAIPHVVAGMMGEPFQTPFAKPPGEGLSTSTVNILWGSSTSLSDISWSAASARSACGTQATSPRSVSADF